MRYPRYFFAIMIATLLGSMAIAGPVVPVPEQIPGVKRVDAEEVIELAGKLPKLVIIDARIAGDRKMGFIENSLSLPDAQVNCKSLAKAIPTKTTPVLFYCNGVKCGRSVVATRIALKCGYKEIYWFRGGFEEWRAKQFPFVNE